MGPCAALQLSKWLLGIPRGEPPLSTTQCAPIQGGPQGEPAAQIVRASSCWPWHRPCEAASFSSSTASAASSSDRTPRTSRCAGGMTFALAPAGRRPTDHVGRSGTPGHGCDLERSERRSPGGRNLESMRRRRRRIVRRTPSPARRSANLPTCVGRASAPTIPHRLRAMRGPSAGIETPSLRAPTGTAASWRQTSQVTARERTPSAHVGERYWGRSGGRSRQASGQDGSGRLRQATTPPLTGVPVFTLRQAPSDHWQR